MTVLNVGVLGLGEVAQSIHLPALADQPARFRISGLYDISPSLVAFCSARCPTATCYASAEALIESQDVDVVFILSSDETHSRFVTAAVRANKHILLEKPPCLTLREVDDLLSLTRGYEKIIFVAYMRRYAPAFLAAKAELPDHAQITHVRIYDLISEGKHFLRQSQSIFYPADIQPSVLAAGAAAREALLREVTGADASPDLVRAYRGLTALSSHNLSAMRELLGDPLRVVAAHRNNDGANTSVILDYGHFTATYDAVVDELGVFEAMIEVRSNRKRIRIVYDTPYIRSLPTRLDVTENDGTGVRTRSFGPLYADAFSNELQALHTHIFDGTQPKTDLADARRDLLLWAEIVAKMRLAETR